MLQSLGQEIWIADGGNVSFFGFAYPTRMAVVRLEDGALLLWSPIELRPELESQVRDLGAGEAFGQPQQAPIFISECLAERLSRRAHVGDSLDNRKAPEATFWRDTDRFATRRMGWTDRSVLFDEFPDYGRIDILLSRLARCDHR